MVINSQDLNPFLFLSCGLRGSKEDLVPEGEIKAMDRSPRVGKSSEIRETACSRKRTCVSGVS